MPGNLTSQGAREISRLRSTMCKFDVHDHRKRNDEPDKRILDIGVCTKQHEPGPYLGHDKCANKRSNDTSYTARHRGSSNHCGSDSFQLQAGTLRSEEHTSELQS